MLKMFLTLTCFKLLRRFIASRCWKIIPTKKSLLSAARNVTNNQYDLAKPVTKGLHTNLSVPQIKSTHSGYKRLREPNKRRPEIVSLFNLRLITIPKKKNNIWKVFLPRKQQDVRKEYCTCLQPPNIYHKDEILFIIIALVSKNYCVTDF